LINNNKYIYKILALFTVYILIISNSQATPTVCLVGNNAHLPLLHRIEAELFAQPTKRPRLVRLETGNVQDSHALNDPNIGLIVAVGIEATKQALLKNNKTPLLSILTRKYALNNLLENLNISSNKNRKFTAIYLDQQFSRQFNLIECLLPNSKYPGPLGVVLGPSSISDQDKLQFHARKRSMELNTIKLSEEENPVAVLDIMIDNAKAILAVPDPNAYNSNTSRGMLLTAYRKNVPIIGYSHQYVKNGALAAIYSTDKQIAIDTANMILELLNLGDKPYPKARHPKQFSVAINYQVAKALGLNIKSENSVKNILEKLEKQQNNNG